MVSTPPKDVVSLWKGRVVDACNIQFFKNVILGQINQHEIIKYGSYELLKDTTVTIRPTATQRAGDIISHIHF